MNKSEIALLIKKRRKELLISQQELAELAEVSIRKISDIETASGETTVGTLQKLLEVLGMQMTIGIKGIVHEI